MPFWATLALLTLMVTLWISGRSNPDDVIGLLEQMLAIALGLVVLFIGRSLPAVAGQTPEPAAPAAGCGR